MIPVTLVSCRMLFPTSLPVFGDTLFERVGGVLNVRVPDRMVTIDRDIQATGCRQAVGAGDEEGAVLGVGALDVGGGGVGDVVEVCGEAVGGEEEDVFAAE